MSGATIVFGPTIADRILDNLSSKEEHTAEDLAGILNTNVTHIRQRLKKLRAEGLAVSRRDDKSPYQRYFWRRV